MIYRINVSPYTYYVGFINCVEILVNYFSYLIRSFISVNLVKVFFIIFNCIFYKFY